MKNFIKVICALSVIPLLIGFYFFDNIKGYYRFKELCEQNKRLVVSTRLERNVGWQLDLRHPQQESYPFSIASIPNIKFVRFLNSKDKNIYDAFKKTGEAGKVFGPHPWGAVGWESDFIAMPSDMREPVVYQLEFFDEEFPNETRLGRYGYKVIDLRTQQIVVTLSEYGYSTFDRKHTLLDAPSGNVCGDISHEEPRISFLDSYVEHNIFVE